MNDDRVFDFGPQQPATSDPEALLQFKLDRAQWERKHGTAPVQITVFSAAESVERDPQRYSFRLPAA